MMCVVCIRSQSDNVMIWMTSKSILGFYIRPNVYFQCNTYAFKAVWNIFSGTENCLVSGTHCSVACMNNENSMQTMEMMHVLYGYVTTIKCHHHNHYHCYYRTQPSPSVPFLSFTIHHSPFFRCWQNIKTHGSR